MKGIARSGHTDLNIMNTEIEDLKARVDGLESAAKKKAKPKAKPKAKKK